MAISDFEAQVIEKSDEELLIMVYAYDAWSEGMHNAVQKELQKRSLLPSDVQKRRDELIQNEKDEMGNGRKASTLGMLTGCLTVFGLLGIYIGYQYAFSKVHSKYTDEVFYVYDEPSRRNGTTLFYVSILLSLGGLAYRFLG